jgi:hypothetical protein
VFGCTWPPASLAGRQAGKQGTVGIHNRAWKMRPLLAPCTDMDRESSRSKELSGRKEREIIKHACAKEKSFSYRSEEKRARQTENYLIQHQ